MRIQKYMAACGVASRRRSEDLIAEGRVRLNGQIVEKPGIPIEPEKDIITVDGRAIANQEKVYLLLNKPKGVISTLADAHAEKTVGDFIPEGLGCYPVGRLDKDTEGLIIMTNDGEMTFRLTHPGHGFTKTYLCKVQGQLSNQDLMQLQTGVTIEVAGDLYLTRPAKVELLSKRRGSTSFVITISEGKNRQIRKMCAAIGHEVIALKRIALGQLQDAKLRSGEWRYLTKEEIHYLKEVK